MRRLVAVAALLLALIPAAATAVESPAEMLPNPVAEQRAEAIGRQLRCLVCQNEDIEDSGADLARDLRRIVREQVAAGRTNGEIMRWMTARYGNFVRLSPPFDVATLLLWLMPVLAVGSGLLAAFLAFGRQHRRAPLPPLSPDERRRLAALGIAAEER